jgi:hypothetical protein
MFWYRSRICLLENILFRFCPESALLDQIEIISFDGADSGANSDILVSFLLVLDGRTFVEHLFLYCFDITNTYHNIVCCPVSYYPYKKKRKSKKEGI